MTEPRDLSSGLRRYLTFHKLDPRETGTFSATFRIPSTLVYVGAARYTCYASTKWEGRSHDYWHDHEYGVRVHLLRGEGREVRVPERVRDVKTLVLLGKCLGFGYTSWDGDEVDARVSNPRPELYTSPSGKALYVVEAKRTLVAVLWSGGLDVREEGIVG